MMRSHSGALAVALLAGVATATACDVSTAPRNQPVTLAVTADTIIAGLNTGGTMTWLQFTLPVAIYNGRAVPVSVDYCLVSIEEPSGTEWQVVWAPVCALEGTTAPVIAPGETKTFQWPVAAAVAGSGGPMWRSQTLNGTYRLSLATDALGTLTSNTFTVNLLTTSTAAALDNSIQRPPRN
jgi:hypothetical protein